MELLTSSRVVLQADTASWADLVRQSAALLERDGIVTPGYVDAIFASFARNGDYMLIAPKVLFSHARPEEGAISTGLSLISTSEDVAFKDQQGGAPVRLFFTFAAADSTAHLDAMATLAQVLVDESSYQELLTTTDPARILTLLNPA